MFTDWMERLSSRSRYPASFCSANCRLKPLVNAVGNKRPNRMQILSAPRLLHLVKCHGYPLAKRILIELRIVPANRVDGG